MNLYKIMSGLIKNTLSEIPEISAALTPEILNNIVIEVPKNRDFGDFSTNVAMVLTRALGRSPRDVAGILVPYFEKMENVASVSVAGPGFINLKLTDGFIFASSMLDGGASRDNATQIIDLDYGGYNIGKELHIGHLRTTVVGDTFNRIARFLGHKTRSYNHMGDWGRPMGLIIAWILEYGMPESADDINKMYPASTARARDDEDWMTRAKEITTALQSGDEKYRKIYDSFVPYSLNQIDALLKRLNILPFDENAGERLIAKYVPDAESELNDKNLIVHSEGAQVVPVVQDADTEPMPPLMWRNSVGAQTYAAADLTAVYYRGKTDAPDAIVYFTDSRQNLHFRQVFRASRLAGFAEKAALDHIGFGTITGADGHAFKTRDGNVPSLNEMINIVAASVRNRVAESGKELSDDTIEMIAIAAIKFNDLMHDVKSDYIFDVDSVTSFEGRTGPYILYTAVRLQSILNKVGAIECDATDVDSLNSDERNLMLTLLDFERTIDGAFEKRATYLLANYAYDLCQAINTFYHNCPILRDDIDTDVRLMRLNMVKKSFESLSQLIDLMGLRVPDAM